MGAFLAELVKAFHWLFEERVKLVFIALFLSGLALFLRDRITDTMMIGGWLRGHRVFEWGLFAFSGAYVVIGGFERVAQTRRALWIIHNPSRDELSVIQTFMNGDSRTHAFIANTATCEALRTSGILEMRTPKLNGGRGYAIYFTMKGWIFRYLKKRPHLYSGK